MSNVLQVSAAHKTFGRTAALCGAELELRKGELLCLLGPNGAGKTTLVRAVAGRVRLDSGAIQLLGENVNGAQSAARRRLGIVPQEIAIYPLLSSRENLEVFGKLNGLTGETLHAQVQWALDWTGLADRSADLTKTFSGGMKRRLNIACGVLHQPEVVLLDEPTVGVDPQSRERIWEMLGRLKQAGASLVLTTHQLDEAQLYCDRITIIDHGRTIASGTLAELVEQTVGSRRRVTLSLDEPLPDDFPHSNRINGGRALEFQIADVARELPAILERIHELGRRVDDVAIQAASLQAVFLHLTGRELRE